MPQKKVLLAAVLALGVAGNALAVTKGGTLYVKAKNTRLMDSAGTNANLLQVLQPGQTVTWLGADPKNKQWHQVEVNGKKGLGLPVQPRHQAAQHGARRQQGRRQRAGRGRLRQLRRGDKTAGRRPPPVRSEARARR